MIAFIWIVIGTLVGFGAFLVENPLNQKSLTLSIMLGVIGAAAGGIMGEVLAYANGGSMLISPLLYIIMGSFLMAMVPSRSTML